MLQRWKQGFARFMYGRYGPDQLNNALLILGASMAVIGMLFSLPVLTVLSYLPLGLCIFRMFSRNANRRRLENQRFMQLLNRLRDRLAERGAVDANLTEDELHHVAPLLQNGHRQDRRLELGDAAVAGELKRLAHRCARPLGERRVVESHSNPP